MSKQTEALKLALEALDDYLLGDENLPFKCAKAITAIREALAEPDYKALYEKAAQQYNELAALMAEQPAQQRPQNCGTGYCSCIECVMEQPAQQQEPVAWVCEGSSSDEKHAIDYWPGDVDDLPIGTKLYTSPPAQRTWVGLTDDEIALICAECSLRTPCDIYYARAIEAKLREKNA